MSNSKVPPKGPLTSLPSAGTGSTSVSMPYQLPASSIVWTLDVDMMGGFCSSLVSSLSERDGNFRMTVGDALIINVPAGCLINQNDIRLVVVNGVGEESVLTGTADCLGNLKFKWLATKESAGPCSFCFDYIPFVGSISSTTASKTRFQDFERLQSSELVLRRQSSISNEPGAPQRQVGVVNRVIVAPRISINGTVLPMEALSMQTVLSRCLGPIDTWLSRLQYPTAELHYNVIHFTPVQVTGESGSCYSLADQLEIAPELLPPGSKSGGWELLKSVVNELESRYGLMSTSDIVLNHTAHNTHWIPHHPECGYNQRNSPHLTAAIELDIALQNFSSSLAEGYFRNDGLSEVIENENSLQILRRLVQERVLEAFRLAEWFEIDIERAVEQFRNTPYKIEDEKKPDSELRHSLFNECLKTVGIARNRGVCPDGIVTTKLFRSDSHLRSLLYQVQEDLYQHARKVYDTILNAIEGYVRWERLECKRGAIGKTHWNALVPRYFTPVETKGRETLHLANNGWVMDWDAEKDFAAAGSLVYLSRSLVAWSDCIKLRYGEGPEDCPFLWNLMKDYCVKTAKTFHGIRLDNCHSTPIHVAKFCLRESRRVNPSLWVYAELFTGKRETDLKFERELGLNALIREALQSYSGSNLAYRVTEFGGCPTGSLDSVPSLNRLIDSARPLLHSLSPALLFDCTHDNETPQQKRTAIDALPNAATVAASVSAIGSNRGYDELVPKVLSVVTERRFFHHYQPKEFPHTSGLKEEGDADFATQARFCTLLYSGSSTIAVKGSWDGWKNEIQLVRSNETWVGDLMAHYYPETSKDFISYEYKFISNGCDWFFDPSFPHTRDSYGNINNILSIGMKPVQQTDQVAFIDASQWTPDSTSLPAFTPAAIANPKDGGCYEIKGQVDEVVLEARLIVPENAHFVDEGDHINGLLSRCQISKHTKGVGSTLNFFAHRYDADRNTTYLTMTRAFVPGSVFIVMTAGYPHLRHNVARSIGDIDSILEFIPGSVKISRCEELHAYSYLLYSCCNEELDRSKGRRGCYALPGSGSFPYAGIAGLISTLDTIRYMGRRLQHPLIENVIKGDWLFDYSADRLDTDKDDAFSGGVVVVLLKIASWLREVSCDVLRVLPRHIVPSYLDWIFSSLYSWVAKRLMSGIPEPLRTCTDPFLIRLALATLQFYSYVPSSPLIQGTDHPSLCAGLPHFSTEYMRAWGRDTFIALKGCLLTTGRYQEAREEILGFARVMRHGLIPNLLDSGSCPRYNARDATWFFLQSIQDYCTVAPEGTDFLKAPVSLKYTETLPPKTSINIVSELMHFILSQHAKGIEFREWNAGPQIDSCMKDEGFHIKITFDPETGFIFGGNRWNCGTWMDKMGSSLEAGTMGIPATPRDGAAVEIIGLLKSTLRFITSLPSDVWRFDVVDVETGLTYKQWNELLEKSFEKYFYIGTAEQNTIEHLHVDATLVNKTRIFRDSFKASDAWRDYQLRPNFCVTLSVSPELVRNDNAISALEVVSTELFCAKTPAAVQERINQWKSEFKTNDAIELRRHMGQLNDNPSRADNSFFTSQLGLKTLDPSDYNYRSDYYNSDRSTDGSISHGFNYHNGPEWIWPVGYFLNPGILFQALFFYSTNKATRNNDELILRRARFYAMRYLLSHRQHIATDKWISLPELTNGNSMFCPDSCPAQAWSVGTLIAFLGTVAVASTPVKSNGLGV